MVQVSSGGGCAQWRQGDRTSYLGVASGLMADEKQSIGSGSEASSMLKGLDMDPHGCFFSCHGS